MIKVYGKHKYISKIWIVTSGIRFEVTPFWKELVTLDWKVGGNYADCPLHGDYEREKKIGKTNPHLKAKKKKILILSLKLKNEKFWLEF